MIDVIVVGQGLAGTALAWALQELDANIVIIDRGDILSASRIAAGLITPVSGKRLTLAPDFDNLFARASGHYQRTEGLTQRHCFYQQAAMRICLNAEENEMLRSRENGLGDRITLLNSTIPDGFSGDFRHFEISGAARLDVPAYLDCSRQFFRERNSYKKMHIDTDSLQVFTDRVSLQSGALSARKIVFCGGYADTLNPWLPADSLNPAKGEILTVRIAGLAENRTVHAGGIWLVPTATPDVYRCGATYDHDDLTVEPTDAGESELTTRLERFMTLPYEVLARHAGIRPVGARRLPIAGCNDAEPRIGWLNGLGSKGALWAPALAQQLAQHLIRGTPLQQFAVHAMDERKQVH